MSDPSAVRMIDPICWVCLGRLRADHQRFGWTCRDRCTFVAYETVMRSVGTIIRMPPSNLGPISLFLQIRDKVKRVSLT